MSKRIATALSTLIDISTYPLNTRQRQKTLARLSNSLNGKMVTKVVTPRGTLSFYPLRGAGAASAVETFHTDEPETRAWIDTYIQPTETLWDVGASIGLYALYAGLNPLVKIIAFEPSSLNFSLLVEHVALNHMGSNVFPICAGLSGQTKLDYLHMSQFDTGTAGNALGVAETQARPFTPVFTQGVPAYAGDDFCRIFSQSPPQHIKLDVDGIEGDILQGLNGILPEVHSCLIEVEGHNADHAAQLIEAPLTAAGFAECLEVRGIGSRRNRLYINSAKISVKKLVV